MNRSSDVEPRVAADGVIVVENEDGLSLRVLPERGLDIGAAAFGRLPLSWPADDKVPESVAPEGPDRWMSTFGGLVTTCGLSNVGLPSEGHGVHGSFTLTAASDVVVERADGTVAVSGVIADDDLVCRRTVTVRDRTMTIDDTVTNTAASVRQAPLLYHVNFGAPFLGPELIVDASVEASVSRGPEASDWRRPAHNEVSEEIVFEHRIAPGAAHRVTVTDPHHRVKVTVGWTGLDRLHQWIDLTPGRYVTSIEPSNCSLQGREYDRAQGTAPVLTPGESRSTSLTLNCERMPS